MNWKRRLRSGFVTGVILVAPLVVTLVALRFALGWLTGFVEPVVSATNLAQFTGDIEFLARLLAVVVIR